MISRRYALTELRSLHRHVEQRAAQAIVDARDERLLVLPLLEARDHVGLAGEDRRDEARNVLGLELQVGGIEHEHVAARVRGSRCAARRRCRAARAVAHRRAGTDTASASSLRARASVSSTRAVVDDDDLVRDAAPSRTPRAACSMKSGRFSASSFAGTSTRDVDVAARRGECERERDGHHSIAVIPACASAPRGRRAGRGTWRRCGARSARRSP